ncbi:hypothetical protein [Microcoleus phage My-WqHQDG]|nr:hypothetical protein [Microcoleus phage My-WqHQDG]
MLCNTCRFYSQDGYCGQGRAVEQHNPPPFWDPRPGLNAVPKYPQEPFSCSGYVEGEGALPMPILPSRLNELVMNGGRRRIITGIPFPVRGFTQNITDYSNGSSCNPFTHTITVAILEGDVGYRPLRDLLNGQTMFLIEGDDLTISINSSYTLQRGGPIVVGVTYSTWQHDRIDLSPYLWWLDPDAPKYAVELYLSGLLELYHASLPDVIQVPDYPPQDFTITWPPRPPSRMSYTTTTYRFREVYEYLCGKYVKHTRDYPTWPVRKVEYEARRWRELMQWYCNQL